MSLPALATQADLTTYGYAIPANVDELLARASARIRLAAGKQIITTGTSTVTFPPTGETCLKLWQFPATVIHTVTLDDGTSVTDYVQVGNEIILPDWVILYPPYPKVTVVYDHGFSTLPEALVELTCSVAVRMSGTKPDRDPAIAAQTVGDVSQTINAAAVSTKHGLTPGEEAAIRSIFYKRG